MSIDNACVVWLTKARLIYLFETLFIIITLWAHRQNNGAKLGQLFFFWGGDLLKEKYTILLAVQRRSEVVINMLHVRIEPMKIFTRGGSTSWPSYWITHRVAVSEYVLWVGGTDVSYPSNNLQY